MANLSDDPNWAPHLLWPDGIPEPTSSLLNMLDETDRPQQGDAAKVDADAGATSSRSRRAREEAMDDLSELERCSKAHLASGKVDSQAAKDLKANREKQRRAQLNNRYADQ
jgi:hypothetical protein